MQIQRRATYEIQSELRVISRKCDFDYNWTSVCIQFFSQKESEIHYVSPNYKIFSLGLLYYVIRKNGIPITIDYFKIKVLKTNGVYWREVSPVYRKLREQFGDPSPIDFKVFVEKIIEFLITSKPKFRLLGITKIDSSSLKPMRSKEFSRYLHHNQNKPKLCTLNQIHEMVMNAFENMKYL